MGHSTTHQSLHRLRQQRLFLLLAKRCVALAKVNRLGHHPISANFIREYQAMMQSNSAVNSMNPDNLPKQLALSPHYGGHDGIYVEIGTFALIDGRPIKSDDGPFTMFVCNRTGDYFFKCKCGSRNQYRRNLKRHMDICYYTKANTQHFCERCKKSFARKDNLKRHLEGNKDREIACQPQDNGSNVCFSCKPYFGKSLRHLLTISSAQ